MCMLAGSERYAVNLHLQQLATKIHVSSNRGMLNRNNHDVPTHVHVHTCTCVFPLNPYINITCLFTCACIHKVLYKWPAPWDVHVTCDQPLEVSDGRNSSSHKVVTHEVVTSDWLCFLSFRESCFTHVSLHTAQCDQLPSGESSCFFEIGL